LLFSSVVVHELSHSLVAGRLTVSDVYVPHDIKWEVTMADDVLRALELMIKEDKGRVVVKDKGGLAPGRNPSSSSRRLATLPDFTTSPFSSSQVMCEY